MLTTKEKLKVGQTVWILEYGSQTILKVCIKELKYQEGYSDPLVHFYGTKEFPEALWARMPNEIYLTEKEAKGSK